MQATVARLTARCALDWSGKGTLREGHELAIHSAVWEVLVRIPDAQVLEPCAVDELQAVAVVARVEGDILILLVARRVYIHSVQPLLCTM